MVSDYKFSTVCGVMGMLIGFAAFLFNYTMIDSTFPGYELLVAPAMFVLSFFSEETYFTPKMILFLLGQFFGYFILAYILRKLIKKTKVAATENSKS